VKNMLEKESNLANMNWIELSIPVRDFKNERMNCLFNVHSPNKKIEWTAELVNAKLRLSDYNNPGWYLQEENMSIGETAVLRRTVPLVSNIMPLFTIEQKYSIQCILEVPTLSLEKPHIWMFSGTEHIGYITVIEMNMSSQPHVIESFLACEARICCAEIVPSNTYEQLSHAVWIGTMSGVILLFDPSIEERHPIGSSKLKDSIISIKYTSSKVFAGLANGTIACFRCKADGAWDLYNPTIVCLGSASILSLAEANHFLWCACGPELFVLDTQTLGTERKISIIENTKSIVKHVVTYGIGVWVSIWKSPKLQLFHAETFEPLQTITITPTISRMKDDIDGRVQNINLDKVYVTSLLAKEGLLWVGVNHGLVLTYPLPKLGGIPTVSGLACVSFHGHQGAVKQLDTFQIQKVLVESDEDKSKADNISLFQSLNGSISELDKSTDMTDGNLEPVYYVVDPDKKDEGEDQSVVDVNKDDVITDDAFNVELVNGNEFKDNAEEEINPISNGEGGDLGNLNNESRSRVDTYDSDEEITADQEFSFIEDEKKELDNSMFALNKEKNIDNLSKVVPELKKNGFADMMQQFQGFTAEPTVQEETLDANIDAQSVHHPLNVIEEGVEKLNTSDPATTSNLTNFNNKTDYDNPVDNTSTSNVKRGPLVSNNLTTDQQCAYENPIEPEVDQAPLNPYASVEKPSAVTVDETNDYEPFNVSSNNVYEPFTVNTEHVKSKTKQRPYDSHNDTVDLDNFENVYDQYRRLPLPQSPDVPEDLNKSPLIMSTPKNKVIRESQYTPLMTNNESAQSGHSATGMTDFDRDLSLNDTQDSHRENYYASLVALSKREEETKKKIFS